MSAPAFPGATSISALEVYDDVAADGHLALFRADGAIEVDRLARLHERAVALVAHRSSDWRARWQAGALAVVRETGDRLDALEAGRDPALGAGRVAAASVAPALGMCGRLQR